MAAGGPFNTAAVGNNKSILWSSQNSLVIFMFGVVERNILAAFQTYFRSLKVWFAYKHRALGGLFKMAANRPYWKLAADLIFFCMHINWPLWPRFRVKIILNFLHDNEDIRANLYAYKRILNRRPIFNKVYWLQNRFINELLDPVIFLRSVGRTHHLT